MEFGLITTPLLAVFIICNFDYGCPKGVTECMHESSWFLIN